jgi:hypothetical protein
MSATDLDAWAKELEGKIEETRARINGVTVKQQRDQQEAGAAAKETAQASADELDAIRVVELDEYRTYVNGIKTLQEEQVKAAESFAKKLVSAERKAVSDLAKVKAERVTIEERYKEALAGLGGDGAVSYGNAQALKVGAREALASGDIATAQAQAQAALKMLQDLAAAGENTYGFGGFIKELQAIELAANDIEQTNAENKIAAIREQIKSLEADAAKLKDMPLSIKSDEASIEAVRSQIQQLVADMGKQEIVLPVRVVHPDGPMLKNVDPYSGDYVLTDPQLPGLATGGWTGPGGKYKPAGVVHADEHVQPKEVVNEPGALPFLEQIRRHGFRNTISQLRARIAAGLPGYAEGGRVAPTRALPAIPAMNPALMAAATGSRDFLGDVNIHWPGGESLRVVVPKDQGENLKLLRLQFGRTHRK